MHKEKPKGDPNLTNTDRTASGFFFDALNI
jgi:hypothetical protein